MAESSAAAGEVGDVGPVGWFGFRESRGILFDDRRGWYRLWAIAAAEQSTNADDQQ